MEYTNPMSKIDNKPVALITPVTHLPTPNIERLIAAQGPIGDLQKELVSAIKFQVRAVRAIADSPKAALALEAISRVVRAAPEILAGAEALDAALKRSELPSTVAGATDVPDPLSAAARIRAVYANAAKSLEAAAEKLPETK